MDIISTLHPILVKLQLVQTVGMYVAITYLEIALGISKAVKLKNESLQRAFKSRTFLYSLPLKFVLITCVAILYVIGSVLSHELAIAFVIPLFVYEVSSIIENMNSLGIIFKKKDGV